MNTENTSPTSEALPDFAARHEAMFELLPWLANGSLRGAERDAALSHVGSCLICRRELDNLRVLATLVKFAAFGAGCVASLAALVGGTLQLFRLGSAIDWRGSLALLVSLGAASAVIAIGLMWLGLKQAAPHLKTRAP